MITVLYKTGNGIDLIGTLELTSSVGFNHFVVLLMLVRLKLFKMSDRGHTFSVLIIKLFRVLESR